MTRVLVNDQALPRLPGIRRTRAPLAVHVRLPGYAPTPLLSCPDLAARAGLAELWVKDETWRLGLPAFKMLGASYACYRALLARLGRGEGELEWGDAGQLAAALRPLGRLTLCAATDGNHGRAVARMARLLGLSALILVPAGTATARIEAIAAEGAQVMAIPGGYDAAVEQCAALASDTCLVISDTSWPGYTEVPGWVMDGYSTIFAEASDQLALAGAAEPDIVVVPVGVGALAAATIRHVKSADASSFARIVGVEPRSARCVTESLRAGEPVTLPFPQTSIMAGLNCGTPSLLAWPLLERGLDAMITIEDDRAEAAVRALASQGIVAGETGAAALAGLHALAGDPSCAPGRDAVRLGRESRVLVLCTEGATDPAAWARITGLPLPPSEPGGRR